MNLNTIKLDGKHKLREGNLPLIAETNYKYNFKENEFKINKPIYFLNENNKKGFQFLTFSVYPFLYKNEKLYFVRSFEVEIYFIKDNINEKIFKIDNTDFINYNNIHSYYNNLILNESYDYLIITIDSAYKILEEHKNYLESKGFRVKFVKLSSISSNKISPEIIRDYLKMSTKRMVLNIYCLLVL